VILLSHPGNRRPMTDHEYWLKEFEKFVKEVFAEKNKPEKADEISCTSQIDRCSHFK
jgi:hypothetical protein